MLNIYSDAEQAGLLCKHSVYIHGMLFIYTRYRGVRRSDLDEAETEAEVDAAEADALAACYMALPEAEDEAVAAVFLGRPEGRSA